MFRSARIARSEGGSGSCERHDGLRVFLLSRVWCRSKFVIFHDLSYSAAYGWGARTVWIWCSDSRSEHSPFNLVQTARSILKLITANWESNDGRSHE